MSKAPKTERRAKIRMVIEVDADIRENWTPKEYVGALQILIESDKCSAGTVRGYAVKGHKVISIKDL